MQAIFTEYFWYLIGCLFIYALGYFTGCYHSDHITRKVIKGSNIKAAQTWKQKEIDNEARHNENTPAAR